MKRLALTLSRYRSHVWPDLAETYGVDGEALYRSRRWRYLLTLIDGLPATSRTRAAMSRDPRVAEEYLEKFGDKPQSEPWRPDLRDWSLTNQLLAQVLDRLDVQRNVSISAAGGKPKKTPPFPTPKTALDEVRKRRLDHNNARLLAAFTGSG